MATNFSDKSRNNNVRVYENVSAKEFIHELQIIPSIYIAAQITPYQLPKWRRIMKTPLIEDVKSAKDEFGVDSYSFLIVGRGDDAKLYVDPPRQTPQVTS